MPHRLIDVLNYNEKKVQQGKAFCIRAYNYLRDHNEMNFYQKLHLLENRNVLNDRATTKTIHISLNFDPSEKLEQEKLNKVAESYMEKIGFGEQPYLVYQHNDAGHPHIHIVSTTIRADGTRINTHRIGSNQSEKARKEIEAEFNLVKADKQKNLQHCIKPMAVHPVICGQSETKRSIANVVGFVVSNYKYSSLPELNAALKQFNVVADTGEEGGRIYKNKGLVYRIIDENGAKTGVPVKASALPCKPVLRCLEAQFAFNTNLKQKHKQETKRKIDNALAGNNRNLSELIVKLQKDQVYTVLRRNSEGCIYGITFVDNGSKCVFNGSDVGKGYSVTGLQSILAKNENNLSMHSFENVHVEQRRPSKEIIPENQEFQNRNDRNCRHSLFEKLSGPQLNNNCVPFEWRKRSKKKRKRTHK